MERSSSVDRSRRPRAGRALTVAWCGERLRRWPAPSRLCRPGLAPCVSACGPRDTAPAELLPVGRPWCRRTQAVPVPAAGVEASSDTDSFTTLASAPVFVDSRWVCAGGSEACPRAGSPVPTAGDTGGVSAVGPAGCPGCFSGAGAVGVAVGGADGSSGAGSTVIAEPGVAAASAPDVESPGTMQSWQVTTSRSTPRRIAYGQAPPLPRSSAGSRGPSTPAGRGSAIRKSS